MPWDSRLKACAAIERGYESIEEMPFACRKGDDANAFMHELLIPCGGADVVLFDITDGTTVNVLAVRHQREDDYHCSSSSACPDSSALIQRSNVLVNDLCCRASWAD